MSDPTTASAAPTPVAADPTVPVAAAPPSATVVVKPGMKTTEFVLTLISVLLTALLNSGLLPDASVAAKIASMILAAVTTLTYTAGRSAVKVAAARGGRGVVALLLLGAFATTQVTACGAGAMQTVKTDASAGFQCAKSSIASQIPGLLSILAAVLTGSNVLVEVGKLIAKYGEDVVACTAMAITAPPAPGAAVDSSAMQAAAALIKLKGWADASAATGAAVPK